MMDISHEYDDIIGLPRPVSETHPRMPMLDRAAQFSPFAALTGYDAAITETARLTEDKRELTEEQKQIISQSLSELQGRLKTDPKVTVVYFEPDARKTGGSYRTVSGEAKRVDPLWGMLELADGTAIPFENIFSLEPGRPST